MSGEFSVFFTCFIPSENVVLSWLWFVKHAKYSRCTSVIDRTSAIHSTHWTSLCTGNVVTERSPKFHLSSFNLDYSLYSYATYKPKLWESNIKHFQRYFVLLREVQCPRVAQRWTFASRTMRVLSVIWHLLYLSVMPVRITSDWTPTLALWRDCIFLFLPQESYRTNWIPFHCQRIYRAVNTINLRIFELSREKEVKINDFKLSPCSECCILSFGCFSGVWILYADFSEHSLSSIVIGGIGKKNYSCLHHQWRWNWQSVPKRRNITFRRRSVTQKKEYNEVKILCHQHLSHKLSENILAIWRQILIWTNIKIQFVPRSKHVLCRLQKSMS